VDWNRIKAEYIAGGTSYRKLCSKYGVPFTTLTRVAKKEKWTQLRQQAQDKADTIFVNDVANKTAKIDEKYFKIVDELLSKAESLIMFTSDWSVTGIKEMATALKYLKECKGVKSDADMREQEARIRNLEKQAESEQKDTGVTVIISDGAEDYSV
jgi:hypothetical protein